MYVINKCYIYIVPCVLTPYCYPYLFIIPLAQQPGQVIDLVDGRSNLVENWNRYMATFSAIVYL